MKKFLKENQTAQNNLIEMNKSNEEENPSLSFGKDRL